jgi:hypothetical protein
VTVALDLYCERTGPSFWAEPLNAVTNIVFIAVAVLIAREWNRRRDDWPVLMLALLTAVIGVGSFLFHTLATTWASIADVAPIAAFILGYFYLAMRRFFQLPIARALAATAGFVAASVALVPFLQTLFGGSAAYIPALLAIVGVAALLARRDDPRTAGLLLAGMLLAASISLRVVDLPLCAAFPIGTHFIWHILNAAVLYVVMVTALDRRRRHPSV